MDAYFKLRDRKSLLLRINILFWIGAKTMSWKLWIAERLFPMAPPFDFLSAVPPIAHAILLYVSLGIMLLLLLWPSGRALMWTLIGIELASCLLDQSRWQTWEYQFIFTLFIFCVNLRNLRFIYSSLLFMLACIYLYSALQKINPGFEYIMWENVILKALYPSHPGILPAWLRNAALLIPLTEILAAAGLLSASSRRLSAIVLIGMHILILYILGPFGLSYNAIVWPWNVMMSILLYLLAIDAGDTLQFRFGDLWLGWNKVIFILYGVLPALNFWGYWDNFLSFDLYSGRLPTVYICLHDTPSTVPLQPYYEPDLYQICNGDRLISLQNWAINEMGVPEYPEIRAYEKMQHAMSKAYPDAGVKFMTNYYPYYKKDWKEIK